MPEFILTNGEGGIYERDTMPFPIGLLHADELAEAYIDFGFTKASVYLCVPVPIEAVKHIEVMADRGMSYEAIMRDLAWHAPPNPMPFPKYDEED